MSISTPIYLLTAKLFHAEVAVKWKVDQMKIYSSTTSGMLLTAVYRAIQAVDLAEGLQKTLECLNGLEISQASVPFFSFPLLFLLRPLFSKEPKIFNLDSSLAYIGRLEHFWHRI